MLSRSGKRPDWLESQREEQWEHAEEEQVFQLGLHFLSVFTAVRPPPPVLTEPEQNIVVSFDFL